MTIANCFQITFLILAAICFRWAWNIDTPYGGDAGLGDAIAKLLGYGAAGVLVVIATIWFAVQHIQFR